VRLVPLTNAGNEKLQRDLQSKLPSLTISTTQSVTTMDVEQLISSAATADVLVVQRHADRLDTVENAVRVLQNSGRRLLGFVIVSR
jgi:hypothetical protein